MDRLPRPASSHAVLFVHGVLDCAFAWVGAGALHALAYRAYDAGCDVWLANLRGTRGCMHTKPDISSREYWDFNINHHALFDLPAIISMLRECKLRELTRMHVIGRF